MLVLLLHTVSSTFLFLIILGFWNWNYQSMKGHILAKMQWKTSLSSIICTPTQNMVYVDRPYFTIVKLSRKVVYQANNGIQLSVLQSAGMTKINNSRSTPCERNKPHHVKLTCNAKKCYLELKKGPIHVKAALMTCICTDLISSFHVLYSHVSPVFPWTISPILIWHLACTQAHTKLVHLHVMHLLFCVNYAMPIKKINSVV